jgi:hypothetical protein
MHSLPLLLLLLPQHYGMNKSVAVLRGSKAKSVDNYSPTADLLHLLLLLLLLHSIMARHVCCRAAWQQGRVCEEHVSNC